MKEFSQQTAPNSIFLANTLYETNCGTLERIIEGDCEQESTENSLKELLITKLKNFGKKINCSVISKIRKDNIIHLYSKAGNVYK